MPQNEDIGSLLFGFAGLEIDGGIANVCRCIAAIADEEIEAGHLSRADRVLLLDEPETAPAAAKRGDQLLSRGSQARMVWQLWRSFLRHRQDLVFFDQLGLARSVLFRLPPFPPPRYAVFLHGIELDRATSGQRRKVLAGAWRLFANSQFTAERTRKNFPEVADRVHLTRLCIDPRKVADWEAHGALPEDDVPREPAVLIVGRMWREEPGKGHDALLKGWSALRRVVPEAQLWIVGEGDAQPVFKEQARSLGLGDCVHFFGRVSDEELGSLYRRASIFAMPSRQEGFGLVYAEAMWHGLPCVGSTADAAVDVISDGETGLLVPYGDPEQTAEAISNLLRDPKRLSRMRRAARRCAREEFSYERFRRDFVREVGIGRSGEVTR
jgi:phosphatidylinositol alpha-1,6-mannosyltransferase